MRHSYAEIVIRCRPGIVQAPRIRLHLSAPPSEWVNGREEQSMTPLWRFLQNESGPTAVEYAVMLALIIGTCVVAIGTFGSEAGGSLEDTSTKLDTYMNN
jgi:pilus assembly protein Flp/PilA